MTRANESNQNNEPKKSELLLTGSKAKEIVEVLVEMYQTMHDPEYAINHDESELTKYKRLQ